MRNHNYEKKQNLWMSLCDILAAMIFVFLIVLAVFCIQYESDQAHFKNTKEILQSSMNTRKEILTKLQEALRSYGLNSEVILQAGILRLNNEIISFPASEANPNTINLQNIGVLSKIMSEVLPCYAKQKPAVLTTEELPIWCDVGLKNIGASVSVNNCSNTRSVNIETIMIEGHTDPTPVKKTASYPDNFALSAMRASNIWKLLKACQPNLAELYNENNNKIFGVSGYAYLRPAQKNPNDPRNRRIDVRFVMEQPKEAFINLSKRLLGPHQQF
ncbi:MAG: hypothetical protein R3B45_14560 [Bdellovibrionota bacterium]